MVSIRQALEQSWGPDTAYNQASRPGVPALGQCYPTARVLQAFFPALEIAQGGIWTGTEMETHFWNLLAVDGMEYHVDLTWQQFPLGSEVREWSVRRRADLNDSAATIERVDRLLRRVRTRLAAGRLAVGERAAKNGG